jgi:hypothetical protein
MRKLLALALGAIFAGFLTATAWATIYAGSGGSWRTVTIPYGGSGGAYRLPQSVYAGSGGSWHLVYTYYSAYADPSFLTGRSSTSPVFAGYTTCTVNGGTAPYTYAWTYASGDNMTITAPTSATTGFQSGVTPGNEKDGTFICTVTDATGKTAQGAVSVTLVRT